MPVNQNDEVVRFSATGYSEKSVYGRSSDNRGHYIHKRINLPPNLLNTITVGYKDWGYPTVESFIRDAIVHRLRYWTVNKPDTAQIEFALVMAEELISEREAAKDNIMKIGELLSQTLRTTDLHNSILDSAITSRNALPEHLKDLGEQFDRVINRYIEQI